MRTPLTADVARLECLAFRVKIRIFSAKSCRASFRAVASSTCVNLRNALSVNQYSACSHASIGLSLRPSEARPRRSGKISMANSQQTEDKRESLWTLAAALTFMVGVLAVAAALDYSGIHFSKPAHGAVIHDQAFKVALANFDHEMSRERPELFGSFSDGDVRIQNCLGFLTAAARPDRRHFFSE